MPKKQNIMKRDGTILSPSFLLLSITIFYWLHSVTSLNNGVASTPPMGWNSWDHYGCNVNESVIRSAALALVSTKLREKGYVYVIVDDCWSSPERSDLGRLVADPLKFPSGMLALSSYVHSLGLKIGITATAGLKTCSGYPGSLNHERLDARTFWSWKIDFLKYSNCHNDRVPALRRYSAMRDAVERTGRKVVYSLCNWGEEEVWKWGKDIANVWRTTLDITDNWVSMMSNFYENSQYASFSGVGGWNDPDMLQVGNGGMSYNEYVTHFSLWAMVKAPLIVGCNLQTATAETLGILGNEDVIAINQDPLGEQAVCRLGCRLQNYVSGAEPNIFTVNLENTDIAVSVTNWGLENMTYTLKLNLIGIENNAHIQDLWTKETQISSKIFFDGLSKHSTKLFRVSPIDY